MVKRQYFQLSRRNPHRKTSEHRIDNRVSQRYSLSKSVLHTSKLNRLFLINFDLPWTTCSQTSRHGLKCTESKVNIRRCWLDVQGIKWWYISRIIFWLVNTKYQNTKILNTASFASNTWSGPAGNIWLFNGCLLSHSNLISIVSSSNHVGSHFEIITKLTTMQGNSSKRGAKLKKNFFFFPVINIVDCFKEI